MEIPVYLFTGFMDSGKTTLIKDTLFNSEFSDGGKTLLFVCEEGEEEYDPAELKKHHVVLEKIENEEDFTEEHLTEIYRKYLPDCIFIEYNGTWQMSTFADMTLPEDWELVQTISTVDATTFEMYLSNMRSMIMEQLFLSDVVVFNRTTDDTPKAKFRRAVKAQNRKAQIVYERENGEVDNQDDEELPYDMSAKHLDISDADYGIFYLDAMDHPKDYAGKTISYRALVYRPEDYKAHALVPGRFAMTCCVEDIQFAALVCSWDKADTVTDEGWVILTAKVNYKFHMAYGRKGPVLTYISHEDCDPPEQAVATFY